MAQKLVRIQSTMNINVTSGLQCEDVTNPDAHVPDRLKVSAEWPKYSMLIKQGVDTYPAEIVNWNTVKALAKDKIITIGEITDDTNNTISEEIKQNLDELKATKKPRAKKLEEIVEEE